MKRQRSLRKDRHEALLTLLEENPLLTDEELANKLKVSIQTIRLDRLTLGLPEQKERARRLAFRAISGASTPASLEVVGELLLCEPGVEGLSRLQTDEGMRLARYNVVRGHFIFAQANSLAVAVVEASHALTASAKVDFLSPVIPGEVLLARAKVVNQGIKKSWVRVTTRAKEREVFRGEFLIVRPERPESLNFTQIKTN